MYVERHLNRVRLANTKQTRNICITFIQCRANVEDVRTTVHKCYTAVPSLLDNLSLVLALVLATHKIIVSTRVSLSTLLSLFSML